MLPLVWSSGRGNVAKTNGLWILYSAAMAIVSRVVRARELLLVVAIEDASLTAYFQDSAFVVSANKKKMRPDRKVRIAGRFCRAVSHPSGGLN